MKPYLIALSTLIACAGPAISQEGSGRYRIGLDVRFEEGRVSAVHVLGETDLPDRTIVLVTVSASGRRLHGVGPHPIASGRFMVKKGRLEATLKCPEDALEPGVYDVVAEVDPLAQYPEVKRVLERVDPSRWTARARLGSGSRLLQAMRTAAGRTRVMIEALGQAFAPLCQLEEELEGKRAPDLTARWEEWRQDYHALIRSFVREIEPLCEAPWFPGTASACLASLRDFLTLEEWRFAFRRPAETEHASEYENEAPITMEDICRNLARVRSKAALELFVSFLGYFEFVDAELTFIVEASAKTEAKRDALSRACGEWGLGSADFDALRGALSETCETPEPIDLAIEELRRRFQAFADAVRDSYRGPEASPGALEEARREYLSAVSDARRLLPE